MPTGTGDALDARVSFPDRVERHIRNHTGDNFPNETFIKRAEREEDDAPWER